MADPAVAAASRTSRVWLLVIALLALATCFQVVLSVPGISLSGIRTPHLPVVSWLALAGGFALAEVCVVHIRWGREAHTFGFGEIPLVLGLFLASPPQLVTARLVGAGLALAAYRRQTNLKLAFNLAQWWLATTLAILVWQVAGDPLHPYAAGSWLAAVGAAVVTDLVATIAINAAIALRGSKVSASLAWTASWIGVLTAGANACFALVALDVIRVDWRGGWALLAVAVFLGLAQRAHVVLQRRHDSLERLNDFSARLGNRLDVDAVVSEILEGTARLLDAQESELFLDASFAGQALGLRRDGWGVQQVDPQPGTPHASAHRSWRHPGWQVPVLSVPLSSGSGTIGVLTVRGRLGDVGGFGRDDLRLLSAVVGHASAALVNGRLADQLREQVRENEYQALHDSLTGLPNRVLFDRHVTRCLAAGEQVTVMLMDLDRFKEVNDTLGHAAGDQLLREAGERIQGAAPGAALVARLGGDEFALLLRGGSRDEALRCAGDVREALLHPMSMHDVTLTVDASIGVAFAPEHGRDTQVLLRHADVAMYRAKQTRSGAEIYSPDEDVNTSTRLSLVSELRDAITGGQLELWYQPKADVVSGRVSTVEALVRWRHPRRGLVPPDDFIPVAEQTGLIDPLTKWVLDAALTQCRHWRETGIDLGVAVNVSPRSLRSGSFPEDVRTSLRRHQVPPARLTLEITEGAIMEDPERAGAVLRELRTVGVRVSVDDFGTGYSSLANLKHLPVDEVKIDKSFITHLADDPQDEAIVAAIVHLVHQLGMVVVAEGVENDYTWQRLVEMGCDVGQGYLISRPLVSTGLEAWLALRPSPAVSTAKLHVVGG